MSLKSFKKKFYLLLLFYTIYTGIAYCGYRYNLSYNVFTLLVTIIPIIFAAIHFTRIDNYKIILEAALLTFFTTLGLDFMAHVTGTWSVVGLRIIEYVPVNDFFFAFFYILLIIYMYEYFIDDRKVVNFQSYFIKLISIEAFLVSIIFIFYTTNNTDYLALMPYFYAIVILSLIFITIYGVFFAPKLFNKVLLIAIALLPMHIVYEIFAIRLGYWSFQSTGDYIALYEFSGRLIPLEEFLWFIFAVTALVIVHEYGVDDRK